VIAVFDLGVKTEYHLHHKKVNPQAQNTFPTGNSVLDHVVPGLICRTTLRYGISLLVIFLLFTTSGLRSQTLIQSAALTEEQQRTLYELSQEFYTKWKVDSAEVAAFAQETGLPIWWELPDGRVIELQGFENGSPVYYVTENLNSAKTISSDKVWPGGVGGLSLTGAGVTVGVWENSGIRTTHQEFGGRITYGDAGTTSIGQHATHVSGTLIGAGVSSGAKGMAYEANLLAFTAANDQSEMASAAASGLRVSSHSYGIAPGWNNNYFGDGKWAWSGNISVSSIEDFSFGFYSSLSRGVDLVAGDAPYYLISKSGGNDRVDTGPAAGTEHWHFSGAWVLSTDSHNSDAANGGYGSVSGVAVSTTSQADTTEPVL
jgi:hypothetical protein